MSITDVTVLITRPKSQEMKLQKLCEEQGIAFVSEPMLLIMPCKDQSSLEKGVKSLEQANWAIFPSSNAVLYAWPSIAYQYAKFPKSVNVATIGSKTASLLAGQGVDVTLIPKAPYNSEALLDEPALQTLDNQQVIIFTGENGRDVLKQTLQKRGAKVQLALAYKRLPPKRMKPELLQQLTDGEINVVFASSGEILKNFVGLYRDAIRDIYEV
jgi:uroporphyrinogen-III synthase